LVMEVHVGCRTTLGLGAAAPKKLHHGGHRVNWFATMYL